MDGLPADAGSLAAAFFDNLEMQQIKEGKPPALLEEHEITFRAFEEISE